MSDEQLMAAYSRGDTDAFEALFERYAESLRDLFAQRAGADHADGLVEQTFIYLHRARADFRPGCKLGTWLLRIADALAPS